MNSLIKHRIKLHIIGFEGSIWTSEVKSSTKIEVLKNMAIGHFYSLGIQKYTDGSQFSMLSVSKKLSLNEDMTIMQEDLKDNDEIILVKCRSERPEKSLRGPTAEEIVEITKNLEKRNFERPKPRNEGVSDFQTEFRRILISLTEAAARLLSPSPDGMKIFNLLNDKMKKQGQPAPENPSVKQLTDMGFPVQKVLKALKIKKMNVNEATEWLLQQGSDSEEDEEQPSTSISRPQNVVEAFQGLLHSLLSARKRQFLPNSKYLQNLKDMGFEEKDAKEALRISGNNQSAACSLLLEDKMEKKPDEGEQCFDRDEPVYNAIIKDPIIQINLTKPKVLFAFLTILENSSTTDLWMSDDEISPVLNQIFKIYHTEKLSRLQHDPSPESTLTSQLTSLLGVSNDDDDDEDLDDEDDEDEVGDILR